MGSTPKRTHPERERTDQSLSSERSKSDDLIREKCETQEGADAVVEQARTRTDAAIDVARRRADDQPGPAADTAAARAVPLARAKEDQALEHERATADEQLDLERDEERRALHDLLSIERESTDRHLTTERVCSDRVLASRDDFLGIVSHDLRAMLGSIALHAAMLIRQSTDDEPGRRVIAHANKIQRSAAHMNRLVGDLVDVVCIEAGRLRIETRRDDVTRLAREAVEAFRPLASAKRIRLDSGAVKDSLMAQFDQDRILQVFANLLANAIRCTPEGGKIEVRVEPEGDHVLVCVADTGSGIPEDKLEAIFARFGQIAEGDRRGAGLGLFISKSIIEAHGGKIWAKSRPGEGSSFFFTLPAWREG